MVIKSIAIEFVPALEVNSIIGDVRGWRNSKSIELLSSDDLTSRVIDWVTSASRV